MVRTLTASPDRRTRQSPLGDTRRVSPSNVAAVRSVYDSWGKGDFRGGVELFDPRVTFVIRAGFPDAGTYTGLDEIAGYTRQFLEPWTRITIQAEELVDAGDAVLATVYQQGVGTGSGVDTGFRYWQVWSLRDGRVVRLENFRDRAEALAAAGLPD
jgi:ketosteroid isomerase-like protein